MSSKTKLFYFVGWEQDPRMKECEIKKGDMHIIHVTQDLFEVSLLAGIELKNGRLLKLLYKNKQEFQNNWQIKFQ